MLVGIHQPHYLPWLRYLEKIARSDVFIVLDDVQYEKNGYQNRNRIKTPQGALMLTAPVLRPTQVPINEITLDERSGWREKHRRAIEMSYRKAPHFSRYWPEIEAAYLREWSHLAALNRQMLETYVRLLELPTRLAYSTEIPTSGSATVRLAELVRAVGGDRYLSGAFAVQAYLEPAVLREWGVRLQFQEWEAPVYTQVPAGAGFIPDLSILDLLFNEGPRSREILLGAGRVVDPPDG